MSLWKRSYAIVADVENTHCRHAAVFKENQRTYLIIATVFPHIAVAVETPIVGATEEVNDFLGRHIGINLLKTVSRIEPSAARKAAECDERDSKEG